MLADRGVEIDAFSGNAQRDQLARECLEVVNQAWELSRIDVRTKYKEILAPEQLAILPGWSHQLFYADRPLHVRLFVQ